VSGELHLAWHYDDTAPAVGSRYDQLAIPDHDLSMILSRHMIVCPIVAAATCAAGDAAMHGMTYSIYTAVVNRSLYRVIL
jgi:hypothetical protein